MQLNIKIDTREPATTQEAFDRTLKYMNNGVQKNDPIKYKFESVALEAGDVECDNIIIERKTYPDFFASIQEKEGGIPRFKVQLVKLAKVRADGKVALLCVHGKPEEMTSSNRKAISTVAARYFAAGIPVCAGFLDVDEFAWFAIRTFMYGASEIKTMNVELIKDVKPVYCTPTEAMLRTVKGVGKTISKAFDKFSIKDVSTLTIPGISLVISGLEQTQENLDQFKKKPYKIAKVIYDNLRNESTQTDIQNEDWQTFVDEDDNGEKLVTRGGDIKEEPEEEESTEDETEDDTDESEETNAKPSDVD
jgi:hypothetical protein